MKWTRERAKAAASLKMVRIQRHKHRQLQEEQQRPWLQDPAAALAWASPDSPTVLLAEEDRKVKRLKELLETIEDDLCILVRCRQEWCVEEEAGKTGELQATGIRDGARKQLLPCLRRRWYARETHPQETQECDAWAADLCQCTKVDLHATPTVSTPVRQGVQPWEGVATPARAVRCH